MAIHEDFLNFTCSFNSVIFEPLSSWITSRPQLYLHPKIMIKFLRCLESIHLMLLPFQYSFQVESCPTLVSTDVFFWNNINKHSKDNYYIRDSTKLHILKKPSHMYLCHCGSLVTWSSEAQVLNTGHALDTLLPKHLGTSGQSGLLLRQGGLQSRNHIFFHSQTANKSL